MAKYNVRMPQGRKFRRTFKKRQTSTRISLAQRPAYTSMKAKLYYPMLPAQFRTMLKIADTQAYQCPAFGAIIFSISSISVLGINDAVPEGFQQLHMLYAKSQVDASHMGLTVHITAGSALEVAAAVLPQQDIVDIPQDQNGMIRVRSAPESQYRLVGAATSGQCIQQMNFSIDNKKILNYADETNFSTRGDVNGNIIFPAAGNLPTAPNLLFFAINRGAAAVSFTVQRAIAYSITYSMRHPARISFPPIV